MVPNGWNVIKLRDVGKCLTGLTYSPKNVVDNGLLVLRSSNVQDSRLAFEDNVYVDLDVPKQGRTKYGDILLCVRNGSRRLIGKSAFITQEAEGYAHGAFMGLFRPIDTPVYTFQLFQSEGFFKQVNQNLGATINSINSGNLYDFKFPYPPIKEREKIAKILSTWDKAISTTERLIENSTQQKKALMQQLLTGKKRLLDDEGKRFEGEWQDINLNDISELMTDYVANGSFQSLRENVSVSDGRDYSLYVRLTDLRVGLGHENQKYTNKKSYDFLKKSSLFGGELLMANIGANVGEVWQMPQVDMPATLAPNMLMTKFKKCAYSKFVYYFLSSSFGQNRVSRAIAGSGHPKINKTDLKQVKVLLPPLEEQQKIANVLTNADKEIELLKQQFADLQQEKKALMQQLLTGKKRVKLND